MDGTVTGLIQWPSASRFLHQQPARPQHPSLCPFPLVVAAGMRDQVLCTLMVSRSCQDQASCQSYVYLAATKPHSNCHNYIIIKEEPALLESVAGKIMNITLVLLSVSKEGGASS
jgi:hypothetical protein